MRRGGERQHCCCGPPERARQRKREKVTRPAEVASRTFTFTKDPHALGDECAGEENREEKQPDADELALERSSSRCLSARGRVQAW